jgi:hypothetical protein
MHNFALPTFVLIATVASASAQPRAYSCNLSDDYAVIQCIREADQTVAQEFPISWGISRQYLVSPTAFSVPSADVEDFRKDAEQFRSQLDSILGTANTQQLRQEIDLELYNAIYVIYQEGFALYSSLITQYHYMLKNHGDFRVACKFSETYSEVICANGGAVVDTFPFGLGDKLTGYLKDGDLKLVERTPRLFRTQCESFRKDMEQLRQAIEARPRKRGTDKVLYQEIINFYEDQMALYDDLILAYKRAVFGENSV